MENITNSIREEIRTRLEEVTALAQAFRALTGENISLDGRTETKASPDRQPVAKFDSLSAAMTDIFGRRGVRFNTREVYAELARRGIRETNYKNAESFMSAVNHALRQLKQRGYLRSQASGRGRSAIWYR